MEKQNTWFVIGLPFHRHIEGSTLLGPPGSTEAAGLSGNKAVFFLQEMYLSRCSCSASRFKFSLGKTKHPPWLNYTSNLCGPEILENVTVSLPPHSYEFSQLLAAQTHK